MTLHADDVSKEIVINQSLGCFATLMVGGAALVEAVFECLDLVIFVAG